MNIILMTTMHVAAAVGASACCVGGTAQQVGGPLDKDGPVGHQFTEDGSVGGAVQAAAEKVDAKGEEMQVRLLCGVCDYVCVCVV